MIERFVDWCRNPTIIRWWCGHQHPGWDDRVIQTTTDENGLKIAEHRCLHCGLVPHGWPQT